MTVSILHRIAIGNSDSVRECIDQYGGLVWSVARRLSRTPADAADATQEIFLQIWSQAARFDESVVCEQLFIVKIARRRLIDRLRQATVEPPMEYPVRAVDSISWSEPGNDPETVIEIAQAQQAFAQLQPQSQHVLELGILLGFTHAEIAKRLKMSVGSVNRSCAAV